MKSSALQFHRPEELAATRPAETQGSSRDSGRLLVSFASGHFHARFVNLEDYLHPGDLLVVNRSATLAASLQASGKSGPFILNLSTNYGAGLWLAEPRLGPNEPGPLPALSAGEIFEIAGGEGRLIAPYPGLPRLWFVHIDGDVCRLLKQTGRPIRYGYLDNEYNLDNYQTIFSAVPGSAEMPSAAYPFTRRILKRLNARGVSLAGILLHTGVSSLELTAEQVEDHPMYPEPYRVPWSTARAVNTTHAQGNRVVAVGTTVVRALESAWDGKLVRPSAGFTSLYIHPNTAINVIEGLLTGLHDPVTSHLAMLYAIAGKDLILEAYSEAIQVGYRWHEFGDSHLILPSKTRDSPVYSDFRRITSLTSSISATAI